MADQKIFAGPRIRRLRMERGLTQTAMAEGLGISPSYLNLIERNQRPITVQLILKLASVYKIDPHELQGETRGSVAALKEVFSDPLLAGELPGDQELDRFRRDRAQRLGCGAKSSSAPIASRRNVCRTSMCFLRARGAPLRFPAHGCRSTKSGKSSSIVRLISPRSRTPPRRSQQNSIPATICSPR